MKDILERAARIKMVVFDVDGVLTDGSLFLGDDGLEYKAFHSRDGHGMKMLKKCGVEIGIITGRTSKVVEYRMQSLGVEHVYQGQLDKRVGFQDLLQKTGLSAEDIAYVGDDIVDLPVMVQVGLAIAVADAHPLVLKHAHWQTSKGGGQGAGRDVCEMLMEARGCLDETLQAYLQ
ncbi:MAG: 3-deoxy-manno-octulosonate-8-phosphatase KdsC [Granulosicoccaceae bacterium]